MSPYTSIDSLQKQLDNGHISTLSVVEHYLKKIEESKSLNIYVEVFTSEALTAATDQDKRRATGEKLGLLAGVVVSIKDVICYKGHTVTAGSKILEGFKSLFSATAVEKLLAEDAIIIGRTNCDEFAMGSTNESSTYGPTRNAADPSRVPGGSSGGAAVAVQANTCLVALGSDTGGSVRQPAAFCGVVGFKPSYGRISRHGLLAYASSFDQIGILAHCVEDVALTLEIIAGADDYDATNSKSEVPNYSQTPANSDKVKIAYFDSAIKHPGLDEEVAKNAADFIQKLQLDGHQVESVPFPLLDYIIPAYYVLTTAEASSNLSRYDGIRFGHRTEAPKDLQETYELSRSEGFGKEVKRRIMLGTFVLSAGYYDAYYAQAQKVRRRLQEDLNAIFSKYDFIFLPASPTPAWPLGESLEDPVAMYLSDIFTVAANMAGLPAISIPSGIHQSTGMPLGVQFMGPAFEEDSLLAFSKSVLEVSKSGHLF